MSIRTPPPAPILRKRKSVEDDAPFEHLPALPRVIKVCLSPSLSPPSYPGSALRHQLTPRLPLQHPRRLETYQLDNDHSMSLSSFETNSAVAAGTSESSSPSFPSTPTTPPSEYPLIQLYPDFADPNAMDVDQSLPESPSLEGVGLLGIQALGDKHNK